MNILMAFGVAVLISMIATVVFLLLLYLLIPPDNSKSWNSWSSLTSNDTWAQEWGKVTLDEISSTKHLYESGYMTQQEYYAKMYSLFQNRGTRSGVENTLAPEEDPWVIAKKGNNGRPD